MDSYAKLRDAFSNKGHSLAGGAAFIYGPMIRPFADLMKTNVRSLAARAPARLDPDVH
jgi:hypothetical protein